jgi:hypothetical protein
MNIFEKIDYAKELLLNATDVFEQSLTDVLLHQYQSELKSIKISDLVGE